MAVTKICNITTRFIAILLLAAILFAPSANGASAGKRQRTRLELRGDRSSDNNKILLQSAKAVDRGDDDNNKVAAPAKLSILDTLVEAYQVGRPSMGMIFSILYLYNNKDPSLWMTLYFGYIFPQACNAGNDYMDWERDEAEEGREFSSSRGKARSKSAVWWHYAFATFVSFAIGCFNPFFGVQYFVITEIFGQLAYNGVFLGVPVHKRSIVKSVGFPLDVLVAAWTFMPFPYLVGQQRWVPDRAIFAWGATMVWGQLKDYAHEKETSVRTTATVLGPKLTALFISLAAIVMVYEDFRFLPYGLYTLYRCIIYPERGVGKMTVVMGLNLVGIVCSDRSIANNVKYPAFALHILLYVTYNLSKKSVRK